jgi:hypothetical protein
MLLLRRLRPVRELTRGSPFGIDNCGVELVAGTCHCTAARLDRDGDVDVLANKWGYGKFASDATRVSGKKFQPVRDF